jgi:Cytochrome P450
MFFYAPRLLLVDPGALLHVLSAQNSYSFPKPAQARMFLERILGRGVLVVEGDVHKRQRKILQPAFNVSAVRDLTPIFFKHSKKLAARVGELVDECQGPSDTPFVQGQTVKSAQASQKGKLVVDLAYWLSRATLDIIGDAGFDWQFNSIDQKPEESGDELAGAFKRMLGVSPTLTQFLATYVKSRPGLTWLGKIWQTSRDKEIGECFQVLEKVSKNIIHNKRQAILQDMQAAGAGQEKKAGGLSKADWEVSGQGAAGDKDLLFLMMRSSEYNFLKTDCRWMDY